MDRHRKMREMGFFIKHNSQPKEAKRVYIVSHQRATKSLFAQLALYTEYTQAARIFRPAAIDLRRKKRSSATHISLENANTFHSAERGAKVAHTRDKSLPRCTARCWSLCF
jgi:hypothetical protein